MLLVMILVGTATNTTGQTYNKTNAGLTSVPSLPRAVTTVYLYRNAITSLGAGTFDGLTSLTELYLYSNAITCTVTNARPTNCRCPTGTSGNTSYCTLQCMSTTPVTYSHQTHPCRRLYHNASPQSVHSHSRWRL